MVPGLLAGLVFQNVTFLLCLYPEQNDHGNVRAMHSGVSGWVEHQNMAEGSWREL